ncbi:NADPH-dependent ferric siderophore reductase, contains FAD-binding and SIP domains [Reichenbachiella agariperforans]|uniref:NADPH-dependent ferric siderophore reductase, contains FAD-binding and SIP domains n=1 Tax=Reichenbachiella agariperforans TaxID=156994 RepID=A0A1M6N392_REIAG|nr:siderophore-interacting protein [Reichenbachiella agariperforans]SHJ90209.1 NADPH-dependent ferric siderophore reductase, contains FAD-binding and SIP domains [Reichenbachiella agariperforans]
MGFVESILKKVVLQEAVIEEKVKLSEAAYRIRIKGADISRVDFIAGCFFRLGIGIDQEDVPLKDKVRSYSVWDINQSTGHVDLAIATHSEGIGADWAKQCKPGDAVYFKWKKGNFLVDDSAESYLMIGDLSALSHLYMIRRHLSGNKKVESIIYSQDKTDLFPDVDGSTPFDFYELPQNPADELITKVKEIVSSMTGTKTVYIAGDSRVCVALNQCFKKELGWDTKRIKTKPFWNPEKKGLE